MYVSSKNSIPNLDCHSLLFYIFKNSYHFLILILTVSVYYFTMNKFSVLYILYSKEHEF